MRWGAEDADVQTRDEGPVSETQQYSIKPAALDFRGDGASVWRKEVLRAAEVDIDDVVVGEYLGVLQATRRAIEDCEVVKKGCEPEQPFRVVPDAFPQEQPHLPHFASHALITFTPDQEIGHGAARNVLIRRFEVFRLGTVPRAIATD